MIAWGGGWICICTTHGTTTDKRLSLTRVGSAARIRHRDMRPLYQCTCGQARTPFLALPWGHLREATGNRSTKCPVNSLSFLDISDRFGGLQSNRLSQLRPRAFYIYTSATYFEFAEGPLSS